MKREDLIAALGDLGYPLMVAGPGRITPNKIIEVLDGLGGSGEPRLIEGLPVILANCAQRGLKLNLQALLSRYLPKSQKRQKLEKLLLLSSELLRQEKIEEPEGLDTMSESLKAKYGDLLANKTVRVETHGLTPVALE
jgi:hypothetical protein